MVLTVGELSAEKSLGERKTYKSAVTPQWNMSQSLLKIIYRVSHLYETHKNDPSTEAQRRWTLAGTWGKKPEREQMAQALARWRDCTEATARSKRYQLCELRKWMNYVTRNFRVCSYTPKKFLKSKTKSALLKTQTRKSDPSIYTSF